MFVSQRIPENNIPGAHFQMASVRFNSVPSDLPLLFNFGGMPLHGLYENKALEYSLSFKNMVNLKKRKELDKLPLIKDTQVVNWLDSDPDLNNVVHIISDNIIESAKEFETTILRIEMSEAHLDHPFEEIEIDVKVPRQTDIYKLNEFWENIGDRTDTILDNESIIDSAKAQEIKERLLIVVSK